MLVRYDISKVWYILSLYILRHISSYYQTLYKVIGVALVYYKEITQREERKS